jgi:hypothetical protein
MIVLEELLDSIAITTIPSHTSLTTERQWMNEYKLPLENCLYKFIEQEQLDDIVCPGCKESNCMKKCFMLYRLPVVLVVQLKRFQFDRYSRRKLTQRIDFPYAGLDMKDFLTSSARDFSGENNTGGTAETSVDKSADNLDINNSEAINHSGDNTDNTIAATGKAPEITNNSDNLAGTDNNSSGRTDKPSSIINPSTIYDLYSVIHHVGVLGGGHYVTTVKTPNDTSSSTTTSTASTPITGVRRPGNISTNSSAMNSPVPNSSSTTINTEDTSSTNSNNDNWYCLNDNLVSALSDNEDVSAPSAYVLFYVRRDMQHMNIDSLLATLDEKRGQISTTVPSSSDVKKSTTKSNTVAANTSTTTVTNTTINTNTDATEATNATPASATSSNTAANTTTTTSRLRRSPLLSRRPNPGKQPPASSSTTNTDTGKQLPYSKDLDSPTNQEDGNCNIQ